MTTWHVMMPTENEADATHSHDVSEGERLFGVGAWTMNLCDLSDCFCVCGFENVRFSSLLILCSCSLSCHGLILRLSAVNKQPSSCSACH